MRLLVMVVLAACSGGGDTAPDAPPPVINAIDANILVSASSGGIVVAAVFTPVADDARAEVTFHSTTIPASRVRQNAFNVSIQQPIAEGDVVVVTLTSGGTVARGTVTISQSLLFTLTKLSGMNCGPPIELVWSPVTGDPMRWEVEASGAGNHVCSGGVSGAGPQDVPDTGMLTWSGCAVAMTDISCRPSVFLERYHIGTLEGFRSGSIRVAHREPFI